MLIVFTYEKRKALVAACKNLNISSVEIQHGTISPFHLGYHYPGYKNKIKYFPDYYISFGKFWQENTSLPIDSKNILIGGFPYISSQKSACKNIKRNEKQILFISQGTIVVVILSVALNLAIKLP